MRTVPVPDWVRNELHEWLIAAEIDRGRLFRRVSKAGKTWGEGITEKAVWHIVKEAANRAGVAKLAPHDLRRTCARLCHAAGGELEQTQFLLGHVSVQTTERSAVSRGFDPRSMIESVSSRLLRLDKTFRKACRQVVK